MSTRAGAIHFAWFAAHLAKLGDNAGTIRLIESDAVTVLVYGDASVFCTSARRTILAKLDVNDPYFRASETGITAVGGLAGEDLAEDFAEILIAPPDGSHRMMTVLEVLTSGRAVSSIRHLLRDLALDPTRPEWQRWRAADAWLNGASDSILARRQLLDSLAAEPISLSREALRAHITAALPSSALNIADIKSVIADFEQCPDDNTVGRLVWLSRKLEAQPRPELFDEPLDTWRSDQRNRRHTIEIESLLDHVLAASIRGTATLSGRRLWHWIVNVRDDVWSSLGTESSKAISAWLDEQPDRDIELFDAILSEEREAIPWGPERAYIGITNRRPSVAIVRHLLTMTRTEKSKIDAKRLLELAVELARHPEAEIDAFWETYEHVSSQRGCKTLLKHLSTTPIEPWRRKRHSRERKGLRKDLKQKAENVRLLAPLLADLRVGKQPGHLDWAAGLYFRPADPKIGRLLGIERVVYFTDPATADAVVAGWKHLATVGPVDIDAAKLGVVEAEGRRYYAEFAAIAGLDLLFQEGRLPAPVISPLIVALFVLKSAWCVADIDRRRQLEGWAIDRLNLNTTDGSEELLTYWEAALDAGATELSGMHSSWANEQPMSAAILAIDLLLSKRPSMPPGVLRSALRVATKSIPPIRLRALAASALADTSVLDAQRSIWTYVAFALDPLAYGDRILAGHDGEEIARLLDEELSRGFVEWLEDLDVEARVYREAVVIRLLGCLCSPSKEPHSGWVTREIRLTDAVRRAIIALSADASAEAGVTLTNLIDTPELIAWREDLRHGRAQQIRLRRDKVFRHASASAIRAAIAGGPPVSAADLRAIAIEEICRLQAELHTEDTTPWKHYWNRNSSGRVTKPLIENECRDLLLVRLQDRLKPYQITAAVPEARRGEGTRTDILLLTGAGRNLPIEAKRHFHSDVWLAASTQLQGYAAAEGADGFGIYIVFWFGNDAAPTPSRSDFAVGPMTAKELKTMLVSDLSPEVRARTDVIVFDVSNPKGQPEAKPRKRKKARTSA